MQIYKVYDKIFRCEFQLFIGELEDFKKEISRMEGYPETIRLFRLSDIRLTCPGLSRSGFRNSAWRIRKTSRRWPMNCSMRSIFVFTTNAMLNTGSAETAPYYLEFLMRGFLEQIKAGQG